MNSLFRGRQVIIFILFTVFFSSFLSCNELELQVPDDEHEEIGNKKDKDIDEIVFFDSDTLKITVFQTFSDWSNMQGGAIYGDRLVCLMATDEIKGETVNGYIYNLVTGEKECELLFSTTIDGRTFYKPHANQVSFGSFFYNQESDFPLLYVSQVNGGNGEDTIRGERGVLVYDLQKSSGGGYIPVLVQVIIPDLYDSKLMERLGRYTPNYIYDTENDQFVVLGYPQSSWYRLNGPQPITIIGVPSISDGSIVTLHDEDVIDSYALPISLGIQQSCVFGSKVYSSGGFAKKGTIRIIDLESKSSLKIFDLSRISTGEPQFFGVWNNRLLYYEAGTQGIMYEFHFK